MFAYKNLANTVSILGVIPICLLFMEGGFKHLIPLLLYNCIMDNLDGILARKLDIRSNFGAILDNVCDAVTHSIFVMVIGMHYGGVCAAVSLAAVVGILLRLVSRIDPTTVKGTGSPTNELIRHLLFVFLLAQIFGFSPAPFLIVLFALHAVSMLLPYRMSYIIRCMTKSATAISLVNISLVIAWLVPYATPIIAACFFITYLYSLFVGGIGWLKGPRVKANEV